MWCCSQQPLLCGSAGVGDSAGSSGCRTPVNTLLTLQTPKTNGGASRVALGLEQGKGSNDPASCARRMGLLSALARVCGRNRDQERVL